MITLCFVLPYRYSYFDLQISITTLSANVPACNCLESGTPQPQSHMAFTPRAEHAADKFSGDNKWVNGNCSLHGL